MSMRDLYPPPLPPEAVSPPWHPANAQRNPRVRRETLPDGSVVWVASDPALDGCLAQAPTRAAALIALDGARAEYVALATELQAQTPVPAPRLLVVAPACGVCGGPVLCTRAGCVA